MIVSETPWRLIWFSIAVLSPVALIAIALLIGIARELFGRAVQRGVARLRQLRVRLADAASAERERVQSINAAPARPVFESIPS
jgi:hypothetical protein